MTKNRRYMVKSGIDFAIIFLNQDVKENSVGGRFIR